MTTTQIKCEFEYKFRVWDKRLSRMTYDVPVVNGNAHYAAVTYSVYEKPQIFINQIDINGKEIYEGDYVVFRYIRYIPVYTNPEYNGRKFIGVVEWDTVNPSILIRNIYNNNNIEYDFNKGGMSNIEVIGNVYETKNIDDFKEYLK